jgi:hypothetical protein
MNKKIALFLIMLISAVAIAQDLPKIAVYVTGDVPDNEKNALGTVMLASLVNSGRYMAIEWSTSFLAEIEREQVKQRSGAIDDNQISELGRQFGVKYVCIAAITSAFGSWQVSARIVDVETAVVVYIGQAFSPLRSAQDLTRVADEVVKIMFRGQAAPPIATAPVAPTAPATPTTPAKPAQQPPAAPPPARTTQNVMEDGRKRVDAIPPAPAKPQKPPLKSSTWAAIGLDVLGAGMIMYGIIEDGNIGHYETEKQYNNVKNSANIRNTMYGIGATALLGGITIHIFF